MLLGATYVNVRGDKTLFKQVSRVTPPINVMFFVLSGMRLDLNSLTTVGIIGAAYFAVRIAGKFLGSWLGARMTACRWGVRRYLGLALIPQAGVSIGLAVLAQRILPEDSGALLSTIILSSSVLYEMIGPVCARKALFLSGAVPGVQGALQADRTAEKAVNVDKSAKADKNQKADKALKSDKATKAEKPIKAQRDSRESDKGRRQEEQKNRPGRTAHALPEPQPRSAGPVQASGCGPCGGSRAASTGDKETRRGFQGGNRAAALSVDDARAKWRQRQPSQLEALHAEGNTHHRQAQEQAVDGGGKGQPQAAHQQPDDVHQKGRDTTAGLHIPTEGTKPQRGQLEALAGLPGCPQWSRSTAAPRPATRFPATGPRKKPDHIA